MDGGTNGTAWANYDTYVTADELLKDATARDYWIGQARRVISINEKAVAALASKMQFQLDARVPDLVDVMAGFDEREVHWTQIASAFIDQAKALPVE